MGLPWHSLIAVANFVCLTLCRQECVHGPEAAAKVQDQGAANAEGPS